MARAILSRRSRGTFASHPGTERGGHERGALGLRRGGDRPVHPHRLCGTAGPAGESAGGGGRDAGAQRRGLERGRSRRVHERLRARLADELRHGRPRAVRVAAAVRSLPGHVFRSGEDARFPDLRGSACATADARPRPVHRAVRAAPRRRGRRERAIHLDPPEAGRPLADPPRPHVERRAVKVLTFVCLLAACKPAGEGVIALEGATLIDGSGSEPVKDALILVKDGHIEAVARVNEVAVPRGAHEINLIGKTVIPGLIDAHAHVERWALERYVAWGVTTVRDLGAMTTDSAIALKNDCNLGSVLGPRLFTSGAMIDGVPPTYPTATGVAEASAARKAVDQRAVVGTDLLKIYTKITPSL